MTATQSLPTLAELADEFLVYEPRSVERYQAIIDLGRQLEPMPEALKTPATKVAGVYSADPKKDPTAEKLHHLSYDEALRRDIRVMDQTAMTMCKDNNLTMVVFGMEGEGNVTRAILGEDLGTVVTP